MSQYPPYPQYSYPSQPMYGYAADPRRELLGPARRASVMMFIVAALMLACGMCFGAVGLVPLEGMEAEQREPLERIESELGMSIKTIAGVAAAMMLVPGLLMGAMGFFVRGGGIAAVVISLILSLLIGVVLLLAAINGITNVMRDPSAAGGVCVIAIPLVLIVMSIVWLIQALRNAPRLSELQAGMQGAYWQSMQQRQQYGGDFWQPPPPPPPPQP